MILPPRQSWESTATFRFLLILLFGLINVDYQEVDERMAGTFGRILMDKAVICTEFYISSGQNALAFKFV